MHYIAHVYLADFYLLAFDFEARYSLSKPLAIVRDKRIIAANAAAELKRIVVGMDIAQARALAPGGEFKAWDPEVYKQHQERWLDICAKYTGIVEPGQQHTAYLDLSLHPDPANVAGLLVDELKLEIGVYVRLGAAPSKWLAELAAECGDREIAVANPRLFLSPLPLAKLLPIEPEQLERLDFLGYRTIGEVADLPLATLKNQFGADGLKIHQAARGSLKDSVQALYPPDQIQESMIFGGEIESLEVFEAALKVLSKRLGNRLRERDLHGADIRIEVEFEEETKAFTRRFAKRMRCPLTVLSAMRLLLEDAISDPVKAIRVFLPKLEQVKSAQGDLLGKNEKDKSMDAALHNLRTVFGEGSVRHAREVELPRYQRVLREWKDALGWQ